MSALTTINPQVLDAVTQSNKAVLKEARTAGSGVAYQHVAQSSAIAVQDAAEFLRNIAAIATATNGVALGMILAGQNPQQAAQAIAKAQEVLTGATKAFKEIGEAASSILKDFPTS